MLGYLYPSFEIPRVLDETLNAEELLYLGILTPVLTLLALVAARRHRVVRFLAVLVVVGWVLAMGAYSLGFPLLHKLPLFQLLPRSLPVRDSGDIRPGLPCGLRL